MPTADAPPAGHAPHDQRRAMVLGLGAVAAWSTVATAFKLALRHLDPYQLLAVASVVSLLVLGIVLAVRGRLGELVRTPPAERRRALALGLLNPFLYYLVLFEAYDRLPAQVAQPLNYTWALTLSWLAIPLLGQRPRARDLLAGVVCYAGVFVIATGGDVAGFRTDDALGVALALGSTLIWSLGWIVNTRSRLDPVVGLFWNFAGGTGPVLLVALLLSDLRLPAAGLPAGAYVGVFEMGLTFVLWLSALRLAPVAARVANLIFLSPFLSLVFIHFVLGEHVRVATIGGLVLIVAGLVWQRTGREGDPGS